MTTPEPHDFNPDLLGDCLDCNLPEAHGVHVKPTEPADLPDLPYAGTSGWSGSDTSRERAEDEDASGSTSERQARVLNMLHAVGATGLTVVEVRGRLGEHHGKASGVLSVLHKEKRVARLTERRDRCAVYVLPEHVNGRETREQGRAAADPDVVKREEWSVLTAKGHRLTAETQGHARLIAGPGPDGGTVQTRTVIETPWVDA